jgi:hypothetical protein
MQVKYQRRIARFQQLANYKYPVIFIRSMGYSSRYPILVDREQYWYPYTPLKDVKDFSRQLYAELKNLFPLLDFKLVVVMRTDGSNKIEAFDNITLYYLSSYAELNDYRNWSPIFNQ